MLVMNAVPLPPHPTLCAPPPLPPHPTLCAPPPLKQAALSAPATAQGKVSALIFEFIIGDEQAFSSVEKALFCEMIEGISGGKRRPCRGKR